jgi:CRP-like cAMP-binding protein
MSAKKEKVMDLSSSLSDIWKVLSDDERELLRKNARIANFKKNELIYCENEIPKDLMCLFKGKVKIFRTGVGGAQSDYSDDSSHSVFWISRIFCA